MLQSKVCALRPGDIMILVRKRSDLARLIVARLYEEKVPVAGIDRLRLNAPLAVRDLLAALRFALQPQDDLNLANLLVSPLIGWTQDDLQNRAPREKGVGLWSHLRRTLGQTDLLAPLYALLGQADLTTPYRYLEHILRSEEHTSELQSLMRISYAVFCLKKKKTLTITSFYTRTRD